MVAAQSGQIEETVNKGLGSLRIASVDGGNRRKVCDVDMTKSGP